MSARARSTHRLPLTPDHYSNKECAVSQIVNLLHTARTETTGGREHGASRSSDGLLDIRLAIPGSARIGANPEQLFAAAWSASLGSAISAAGRQRTIVLPVAPVIEAEVDLCLADGAYFLRARLDVRLPGVERDIARALVNEAHQTCAYSKATRGNIDVVVSLV
jgi:lipoyl-dependent peroxiredoxin